MASGTPTQRAAQIACSLGDSSLLVQQLYCLSSNSFERMFAFNPILESGNLPANDAAGQQIYPTIVGGARDSTFDCSGTRKAYGDLSCTLTLTLAPGDDGNPKLFTDANTSTLIQSPINVTLQGSLSAEYKDPRSISQQMKKQYKLTTVNLQSKSVLTWVVRFQPTEVTNDGPTIINAPVNSCYNSVFQDELSAIIVCVYTIHDPLEAQQYSNDSSLLQNQKLSLWIAPTMDAVNKDTSQNILVVVQKVPPGGTIDRSVYPPPWFQQWRVPDDPVDNVIVLARDEFWAPICLSLMQNVLPLTYNYDPEHDREGKHLDVQSTSTIAKQWTLNSTPNDFDWLPGPANHTAQTEGTQSLYKTGGVTTLKQVFTPKLALKGTNTTILVETVQNRLYFTPGDDTTGSDLPMQRADSTLPTTPRYQMLVVGKTSMEATSIIDHEDIPNERPISSIASTEMFWQMFFSATQLTSERCSFETSTPQVIYQPRRPLDASSTLADLALNTEVDGLKYRMSHLPSNEHPVIFAQQLEEAVTVNCNIYLPTQQQFSNARCFLSNEGALMAPAAFS